MYWKSGVMYMNTIYFPMPDGVVISECPHMPLSNGVAFSDTLGKIVVYLREFKNNADIIGAFCREYGRDPCFREENINGIKGYSMKALGKYYESLFPTKGSYILRISVQSDNGAIDCAMESPIVKTLFEGIKLFAVTVQCETQ